MGTKILYLKHFKWFFQKFQPILLLRFPSLYIHKNFLKKLWKKKIVFKKI